MFVRESKAPHVRWVIIGLALIVSSVLAACAGTASEPEETEAPPTATDEVENAEVEATDEEPVETDETESTDDSDATESTEASDGGGEQNEIIRVTVGPELRDCVGVGPQTCMLVKKEGESEFSFFYDGIEGFEYQEGIEYDLLIEVVPVENPPEDASSMRWVLVEVIDMRDGSQQSANEPTELEHTEWRLISINDEPIAAEVVVTATFSEGQVGGNAGCNGYSGGYTVDGENLMIGQLLSTMMACEEPFMSIETNFLGILQHAERYSIVAGELIIDATQGESLSFIAN